MRDLFASTLCVEREPVSLETVRRIWERMRDLPPPPRAIRAAPDAVAKLTAFAAPATPGMSLLGLPVIEDPSLAPGEWRLDP